MEIKEIKKLKKNGSIGDQRAEKLVQEIENQIQKTNNKKIYLKDFHEPITHYLYVFKVLKKNQISFINSMMEEVQVDSNVVIQDKNS